MYSSYSKFFQKKIASRLLLVCILTTMLGGCAKTLREQYISKDDPCNSAREPIVKAGDDIDQRNHEMAKKQAAMQMKGHELPVMQRAGQQVHLNIGNFITNSINQATLESKAYMALKQQENGSSAAVLLASVEGDARTDNARMKSVTRAMSALRSCRRNQIVAIQNGTETTDSSRMEKLRQQQTELDKDDQLISNVFGQYADRAQIYADTSATVTAGQNNDGPQVTSARAVSRPASAHRTSVDVFRDEQHQAQVADRKQSDTLHETLKDSIGA